jgi:nucleoside-diphosphate-sugar epimerase
MRVLVVGGSGFLSGTLAAQALAAGHHTSVITRGQKILPPGVQALRADRKDRSAFAAVLASQAPWDLVVDCIAFEADDARLDLEVFSGKCGHFAFVSTDFVYDPPRRKVPQVEDPAEYLTDGYGGQKREAERVFEAAGTEQLPWTIFRPSHIYGPGSLLGCLPLHGRDPDILTRIRKKEPLRLIGGGRFLQHPVFAPDLAATLLDLPGKEKSVGQIYNIANPDIVESRRYYEIIGEILGESVFIEEVPTERFLSENPDKAPFCCDRVYDLGRLKASGLKIPATTLQEGLRQQVVSLDS